MAAETASFKLGDDVKVISEDGRLIEPGSEEIGMVGIPGYIPVGYYKDPEKTAKTFRTVDGVRYSIPGDFATVATDGSIHLLGRGSVVINTGGEKVYPEEVEEVLQAAPGGARRGRRSVCPTTASARRSARSSNRGRGPQSTTKT